jgi:hypothetical protein
VANVPTPPSGPSIEERLFRSIFIILGHLVEHCQAMRAHCRQVHGGGAFEEHSEARQAGEECDVDLREIEELIDALGAV